MSKKVRLRGYSDVKSLTVAALLMAMSVVIGMFCKNHLNFGTGPLAGLFRITFENLPIILSGIFLGPITGGLVGCGTDIITYFLSSQIYPPNLLVTLGALLVGVSSGVVAKFIIKKRGYTQIIASGAVAHIIGSMIVKPIGLFSFYGMLVLWRIPLYLLVIAPIEITLICLLYRNKNFRRLMERASRNNRTSAMTYEQALEYIHSVCWKGSRPGLERITELCERLGNPQDKLKFIHVTGTNGKGSTCAMTESVLRAAGYRTGLFTSPYVKHFNERMAVNGQSVSNERLAFVTSVVKTHADAMQDSPTEFELITAIAFVLFELEECDIVVLEAGMGGRLDSTNVIKNSVLSVITGVALEHTEYLGDTIEKIAAEKAGIIKPGCPVLYGGPDFNAPETDENGQRTAFAVIKEKASELGSELHITEYDKLNVLKATLEKTTLEYGRYKNIEIPLLGLYQPQNCAKCLEIIDVLRTAGYDISAKAIRKGLKKTVWHARFEKLSEKPLVLYDGSHNPDGIEVAIKTIRHYFGENKVNILVGVMADKDYEGMMGALAPLVNKAFAVTPDNPRALPANELKNTFDGLGVSSIAFNSLPAGVKKAVAESKKTGTPLVCLGSLYMYAEVTDAMEK